VIGLYYYGDVTMKQIGCEIGVNESRVSQLHARAVQRLRKSLGSDLTPDLVASAMKKPATMPKRKRPALKMAKVGLNARLAAPAATTRRRTA
jgi:hypothetical protein